MKGDPQVSRERRIVLGLIQGFEFYIHNEQQPELWIF